MSKWLGSKTFEYEDMLLLKVETDARTVKCYIDHKLDDPSFVKSHCKRLDVFLLQQTYFVECKNKTLFQVSIV